MQNKITYTLTYSKLKIIYFSFDFLRIIIVFLLFLKF